jgi:hypothetical protein
MQPVVADSQSFRRLLEFWTIVAENDDKTKKIVYQCWLRLVERLKSGGPSLGRSPGAHKQRRPANQNQIQIFGEIGSTQLVEQGLVPCSFFFEMLVVREACIRDAWQEVLRTRLSKRT